MAFINTNRNFDTRNFDPNTYQTSLDTYNGLIKNDPYEPTFSIDPETGKVTASQVSLVITRLRSILISFLAHL